MDQLNRVESRPWSSKRVISKLVELHEGHGRRLLLQASRARNAKYWVDADELARVWSTHFAPGGLARSEEDRLRALEDVARQVLDEVTELRRSRAARVQSAPQSKKK